MGGLLFEFADGDVEIGDALVELPDHLVGTVDAGDFLVGERDLLGGLASRDEVVVGGGKQRR